MILSPSLIAIRALGLEPSGTMICEAEAGERCAVCGDTLRKGEPIDTLDLPPSFTNHSSLAIPGGHYRCGACTTVMTNGANFQMGLSTCIASASEGYFPIMKKEHRAWAFLTPPEPPFIITIQNAQQQHTVWRAPVSTSRDILMVRLGEQVLRLRRQKLVAAREAAIRLDAAINAAREDKPGRGRPARSPESIESPFFSDWKGQDAQGGQLKKAAADQIASGAISDSDIAALTTLNSGEIWALTAVLHLSPVRPEPAALK